MNAPSRTSVALRFETRLQWRYRFLQAAVFSGVLWLAMLIPLTRELRSLAEPYVMLGDLAVVGYFFIAGSVFFEKGERTLQALAASPLRFREYLASKTTVLAALSTVLAVFVATVTHGLGYDLPMLLLGTVLGTVVMLLVGFVTALPFRSITDWFLPAMLPLAVLNLPVLYYSGVWPAAWFYLLPTQGPLLLLGAAFGQRDLAGWQLGYSVAYPILCTAALCLLAHRMYDRFVVARTGEA